MYITIEGIDTAGKSTQIELLKEIFNDAIFIKEPGETKIGKQLREMIFTQTISKKTELFLFLADRSETIETIIKPNRDKFIISDRSLISGIAYGLEFFNLLELEMFNSFATNKIYPDLVIILKLNRNTLEQRLSLKSHDNIEKRGIDYLLSIQDNLIETTNKLCIENIVIDASLDKNIILKTILEKISTLKIKEENGK
jgi:dTMP kinase